MVPHRRVISNTGTYHISQRKKILWLYNSAVVCLITFAVACMHDDHSLFHTGSYQYYFTGKVSCGCQLLHKNHKTFAPQTIYKMKLGFIHENTAANNHCYYYNHP